MSAIALDPLIAEAKRRTRRRRLIALGLISVAAAATVATLDLRTPSQRLVVTAQVPSRPVPISWFGVKDGVTWAATSRALWLTTDGGATWRRAARVPQVSANWYLADAAFVDPRHGWVVAGSSSRGVLARTTDGGRTWIGSSPVNPASSVSFSSPRRGYLLAASDSGASLLRTTDGGVSWVRIARAPFQWGSVESVHGRDMWVVGGDGLGRPGIDTQGRLFRSRDGGRTWRWVRLPDEDAVRAFAAFGSRLVAAGNVGRMGDLGVYVSSDGGRHWTLRTGRRPISMGVAQFPFSVASADTWFAAWGPVLRTTDAGRHWRSVFTPPGRKGSTFGSAFPTELDFSSPRVGWAVFGDNLMRTTDAGRRWTVAGPRVPKHHRHRR